MLDPVRVGHESDGGGLRGSREADSRAYDDHLSQQSLPVERSLRRTGARRSKELPAFCRVQATIDPSGDSAIRVEVWLPLRGWNQRFEGSGNGGFAGSFQWGSLGGGVVRGYAVANTDMGMGTPPGQDASLFVGRPERWIDWGYRSTHEMTIFGKAMVSAFYGRAAKKNYFTGCSTGGQQALMEAQRFPEDYDGIIGGAPAHNRTALHEDILWNFLAVETVPGAWLPEGKVAMLSAAVMRACDELDGVKDNVIGDPRRCSFDPGVLACKHADAADCLTGAQVDAVRKVYAGPTDPRTGQNLYSGLMRGSESGWNGLGPDPTATVVKPVRAPFSPMFEWVFGSQWDWRTFEFKDDADLLNAKLAGLLNATSTDLDAFRRRGGKLLLYHGWADPELPRLRAVSARTRLRSSLYGDLRSTLRLVTARSSNIRVARLRQGRIWVSAKAE